MSERKALMHMDGCHFFVWAHRDHAGDVWLTYGERSSHDLAAHGRFSGDVDGRCDRCVALRAGAKPRNVCRVMPGFPEDAKAAFFAVMVAVAEIDEIGEGEGSRPALQVAPDLPEKLRNEDDATLRNYLSKPKGIDE